MPGGTAASALNGHPRGRTPARRRDAWPLDVAVVLTAALAGLLLVVQGRMDRSVAPAEAADGLERWAREHLERNVEIGRIIPRILPRPGVELRRVRIRHRPGTRDALLASARSIRLEADLPALLLGRVEVGRINLDGADLHLTREPGGGWPRPSIGPRGTSPGGALPVTLHVRRIRLEDGTVTYRDRRGSLRFRASELTVDARRRRGPDAPGIELRLRGMARGRPGAPLPRLGPVPLEARLNLRWTGAAVRLEPSTVRLGHGDVSVDGHLQPGGAFRLAARLEGLPLGRLPALPGGWRLGGTAAGELRAARADAEAAPRISGRYRLRELSAAGPGGPLLDRGRGDGRLLDGTLSLDSLAARVLGEPARLGGRLDLEPGLPFHLRFRGEPRMGPLVDLAAGPGPSGEGRIRTRLAASGLLVPYPVLHGLEGTLTPVGVRLRHPALALPLSFPDGRIRLGGGSARTRDLPLLVGGRALAFTGSATGLLDLLRHPGPEPPTVGIRGSLTGPSLDLSELLPGSGGRRPTTLPDVDLTLRVDTLRAGSFEARGVDLRIRSDSGILGLGPASLRAWGGTLRPDLTLGMGDDAAGPFSLRVAVDSVRLGRALEALVPEGRAPPLEGRVSGRIEASGEASARLVPLPEVLAGSGSLELTRGRLGPTGIGRALAAATGIEELADLRFSSASGRLRFSGTGTSLDSIRVEGEVLEVRARGSLAFDGTGRLTVWLLVPYGRLDPAAPVWGDRHPEEILGSAPAPDRTVELRLGLTEGEEGPRVELGDAGFPGELSRPGDPRER